jgi:hypothetical protein
LTCRQVYLHLVLPFINRGKKLTIDNNSNNMKTIFVTLVMILFSVEIVKAEVASSSDSSKMKVLTDARESLKRLDSINASDKTNLTVSQKKKLKKEVREIKNHLYDLNGSRHIPFGAVVVLLLLPFAVYQTIKE